ncbi:MAG: cytochrome d ubiquinol oxidase subunit II [Alistipes sp.]|jgi:cytochrome d ubiquinol oxidase subunit II|uniref:cytochrome d ubiquinol oxidase subunit II n=1 Tax=Alistipes TaxID=239759 RepID=UPI0023F0B389|nr:MULTISPECIES: cytochrome d ubiquinol oxidase subunit II [Alistipes]MBS5556550.1 cytochrome d ubiquinol oxidase subunit II [Alistipes sp.]
MDTLLFLQHYWWFLISLLGALLVFLLFVQGGQGLLYTMGRTEAERDLVVNALGRKWEFTFTTLVTFGGAFFASFPLFYSTSFGGAFYVWMAILLVFVVQAVSYEYRRKPSNVLGQRTYEAFLVLNGVAGPLLLGVAVGTFFTGAEFTVNRMNMAAVGGDTAISQWATPWHGLEALTDARNLLLGVAVFALSRVLALHFFLNNLDDETLRLRARRLSCGYSLLFLAAFLAFFGWLLCSDGRAIDPASGTVNIEPYKYLHNLLAMPAVAIVLLAGVAAVLWGLWSGGRNGSRRAIWFSGAGTILTVLALLLLAGWNDTCYYPSLTDMQSSLAITNSSSSLFTLKVMSVVSLLIPFVAAYIWYAWRALTRPISEREVEEAEHKY